MRIYKLQPGKVGVFLKLFEENRKILFRKGAALGKLVGWWYTDIGPVDEVVQIYAFENMSQWEKVRKAQEKDAVTRDFRLKTKPMVQSQNSRFMTPASFSPLK